MKVVGSMLRNPAKVEIARKGTVAETVDQYVIHTTQSVKPALIKAVLAEKNFFRVIVFARTRSRADSTCRRLKKAGYAVEAIHSDRSQSQRRRALKKFADGEINIITATDVLARGIDVDQVDYVINYDVPEQAEDYVHRIGRTGRAGARGFAVTFVTPETEKEMRDIEKLIKKSVPEMQLQDFDMAQAEADAAEASITAQSKRDPEVNRVKRSLANKAQLKAEQASQRRDEQTEWASAKRAARKRKPKAQEAPIEPKPKPKSKAKAKQKPKPTLKLKTKANGRSFDQKAAPRPGSNSKTASAKRGSKAASPAAAKAKTANPKSKAPTGRSGDIRPGRAHRAEIERARSRSRKRP